MSGTTTTFEHQIGAEGLFVLQLGSGDVRLHGVDGETVRIEDRHGSAQRPHGFDVEAGEAASRSAPEKLPAQVRPDGTARLTWTCASRTGRRSSSKRRERAT